MKLPALYLIDSILKNVGDPYRSILFLPAGLVQVFTRVVGDLRSAGDERQAAEFRRVLQTWRAASIFPEAAIADMERALPTRWSTALRPPPAPEQAAVPFKLPSTAEAAQMPPLPSTPELLEFVLQAITIARSDAQAVPHQMHRLRNLFAHLRIKGDLPEDAVSRLEWLVGSERWSEAFDVAFAFKGSRPLADQRVTSKDEQHFELTYESVMQSRPGAHSVIYAAFPLQCRTCAFRFPATDEGRGALDTHLDGHFRKNMRMREKSRKMLIRGWMLSEAEWAEYGSEAVVADSADAVGKAKDAAADERHVGAMFEPASSTVAASAVKEMPQATVSLAVEEDDPKQCPACLDRFEVRWSDDMDEWVYVGDVVRRDDGLVLHRHCIGAESVNDSSDQSGQVRIKKEDAPHSPHPLTHDPTSAGHSSDAVDETGSTDAHE